jgi:hypothetical protein
MSARLLGVVATAFMITVVGCKNETKRGATDSAPTLVQAAPISPSLKILTKEASSPPTGAKGSVKLTVSTLANMTYRLAEGKSVTSITLVDSKGQTNEEDGGEQFWLDEEHVVFGDLDGDGVDDAIVVLVSSGGGSGIFYQLVAVKQRNGIVETPAVKSLGDRITINRINITNRIVAVDMITHGPDDPSCCPTERQVLKLKVQGSEFVPAQ